MNKPLKVLVIEDEPSQSKILKLIIERYGWEAIVCSNLESAFDALITTPSIGCILADRHLEDGRLPALFAKLTTEFPAALDIPVILVTASALKEILAELPETTNIIGFTRKPYQHQILVALLNRVVENNYAEGPAHIATFRNTTHWSEEERIAKESDFIWL